MTELDCGCPFDYPYTCPACGWTDPGKRTPLQALGVKEMPGAGSGQTTEENDG